MKTHMIQLLAVAAFATACAHAAELTVTVTDIRVPKGTIRVGVVDSESGWANQFKPVAAQIIAATGKEVTLHFADLPAGTYAVQVMHDENDNGKLDRNMLGVPTEGYGFSNNPQGLRRARFDEAQFALGAANTKIVVRLR